jgi:hypothetical protein
MASLLAISWREKLFLPPLMVSAAMAGRIASTWSSFIWRADPEGRAVPAHLPGQV